MVIFPDYSLCIRAHDNAVKHGFWDKPRDYIEDFQENVLDEFKEASEIIEKGERNIDEVYYTEQKDGSKKLEGVPTELADIIILILDYICGQNIDEETYNEMLRRSEEVREKYKNNIQRVGGQSSELALFKSVEEECEGIMGVSQIAPMLLENLRDLEAIEITRISELLKVVQCVIAYAEYYDINIEARTIEKMEYNEKRPVKYKKGQEVREIGGTKIDYETLEIRRLSEKLVRKSQNSNTASEEIEALAKRIQSIAENRARRMINGTTQRTSGGVGQGDEDGR